MQSTYLEVELDVHGGGGAAARILPTPVYSDGWPRGACRCVNGEALQTLSSVAARGFYLTDEMRNKFGWVGSTPGDELSFCLVDDTASLLRVSGTGAAAARQQQPQQPPPQQQQPELLQQQQPELQRRMRLAARLSSTPHECVDREGTWAFPQSAADVEAELPRNVFVVWRFEVPKPP